MQEMKSIEQYAIRYHRIHPRLLEWIQQSFNKLSLSQPPIIRHQKLILSPESEVRVLIYRGDINSKWTRIENRRFSDLPQINHSDAIKLLNHIPNNHRIKVKFDLNKFLNAVERTNLWIAPLKFLPSGRATKEKNTIGISQTPCFMFLNSMIWARNVLNQIGMHAGNCFDLSTVEGMALLLHELYHIYQFYRNPLQMLWNYIRAVRDSLVYGKIFFAHPYIPFEIEAIAFEEEIQRVLSEKELERSLKIFQDFR
jgi:hypothetical protein